jgi:hypothetical protein
MREHEILEFHDLALQAQERMSRNQAKSLELKLLANPEDVNSRVLLIGFYHSKAYRDASYDRRRVEHILWFIRNCSEHPIVMNRWTGIVKELSPEYYSEAKKAWMSELEKPTINEDSMRNAVSFFAHNEPNLALTILHGFKQTDSSGKWDEDIRFVESLICIQKNVTPNPD